MDIIDVFSLKEEKRYNLIFTSYGQNEEETVMLWTKISSQFPFSEW